MSLEEIAGTLNAQNVPPIHGTNRWTPASVRKVTFELPRRSRLDGSQALPAKVAAARTSESWRRGGAAPPEPPYGVVVERVNVSVLL
jgi:hypothetical protein